jgi:MoaA/NifB/PqqE/SkfB family radical SAM enzyme
MQLTKKIKKVRSLGLNKSFHLIYEKSKRKLNILPAVPPTLYIELTDICNLKCIMCDRNGMTRKSGMMDMELFKKIIDNAAEIGVPAVKLNRFGESLLHPQLVEMIRHAKEKGIPRVYFTSNATLLTEEKARQLIPSGLDSITFSFDGATKETYESIRLKANYDKVKQNILTFVKLRNDMRKDKPRVVINTILSKDTEQEIYEIFTLWAPYVDKINILPVGRYGGVDNLSSITRENSVSQRRACHQIFDRLVIFWDSTATICCGDINGDLSVGNINDSRIEDLWRNRAFSEIRRRHKNLDFTNLPICLKCDGTDALQYKKMYNQRKLLYKQAGEMGYKHLF